LSSSGLFLRNKKLRACPYGLARPPHPPRSPEARPQPRLLYNSKKNRLHRGVQDLLFLKYLLKLNITEKNAIQNSFFSFFSSGKNLTHYLLTNSIENIESILYKTLKCNTSVLPLKIRNPLKSAYFLALFIGNGLKKKRSLRQIFRLITKFKKKKRDLQKAKKKKFYP
jgi:hypothetical protein